ncbi:MAG TPA: PDZ domain-containing protein [Vicinamibacterales bacterium]|nr:PDZ domain-containing protein [Vicinamibacterales bacterium]
MTKLLSAIGVGVTLLGVFALMIVLAPSLKGQTVKSRPFMELRSSIFGGSGLGITVRDVDESDVKREKLAALAGAVVEDVQTDGPAAKAGMKAGDVIVTFDGEKVRSARHLSRLIEETPEGREVEATVVRAGEKVALKTTPVSSSFFSRFDPLMKRHLELNSPNRYEFVTPKLTPRPNVYERFVERRFGWNGVTVQDLTGQLGDYFGTREGVLVTDIEDGSAAKTLGLKAGDVITKIDDYAIRSSADWWRRIASAPRDVTITIMRDRKELTLKGKIE